ncbi:hypothetical protein CEP54_002674 [Fusarium duplospermum]|uniref:Uncharacterized protein n=1 Tax=Fusarium duplospermum TaxID=1325734 RepID=A0A428QTR8_9HYPO|nr:hypothetical protein CEP54_002674 [Fusarium duplospermum]
METLDNRETAEPTGSDPPGESISTRASACESAFVKGLCLLDSNQDDRLYATALRKLQKRFTNWTGYLGVFAGGNGSLDQRLKRHPQHGDLVVVALNMLKDNLLQVTAEPSDQGSDDSSDEETERRQIELEGIRMSINELDRLAILIRQSSTSSLDARVKAFASKRAAEVSSFETKAILAVNALYPDANESLCQRLSKSMVHRAAPQNQIAKSESDTRPEPVTRAGSAGISLLSETIASDPVSRFSLLPKPMEPVKQRAGATTVLETGALFPKPPKFDDGDETAPCPLCRKVFQRHDFTNDVWWKSHVNEDLVPFVCVATSCLESSNFTRRSEWRAHIEQDHGVVWQQNPGIALHDENKAHSPDSQGACENVTICPLCCSSPLEEPRQLRARNPPTSSESPKALQAGSKEAPVGAFGKKTVRFDVPKQGDSPTALPATSRLGMKPAKHMTMANHIAGHLQFLALLTPRLSTKSLTDEEDIDFASSQALSGDSNSGERSTLGDELELEEGQNTQNLEIRASSSETNPVPVPEESIAPQDEDIPPTEPMDWALFSPLDPTHEGNEDTIPKHIKESLLKDAASRFARADLPTEAIEAAETLATLLRQGDPCTNFGSLIQFDKDLTRESLYRFFNTSLSSVDDGDSLRTNIYHYLVLNADGNFLWVSMACRDLEHTPPEDILESLTVSGDSVNLWDMSILEIISRFKVEGVSSFAFFHQRLLAFGTRAGKVSIRDIATGKMSLEILRNGGSGVASLAFSSDGDLLVLVTFTGTIEIWDLPSRTLRQCFQSTKRLTSRSLNNRIASLFMTDPGALSIDSPELVNMARAALKVDHHVGFELSDDGDWITKDGKQVLWLPPEFQASCSAVAGNVVVISCQSGLSRFEFE